MLNPKLKEIVGTVLVKSFWFLWLGRHLLRHLLTACLSPESQNWKLEKVLSSGFQRNIASRNYVLKRNTFHFYHWTVWQLTVEFLWQEPSVFRCNTFVTSNTNCVTQSLGHLWSITSRLLTTLKRAFTLSLADCRIWKSMHFSDVFGFDPSQSAEFACYAEGRSSVTGQLYHCTMGRQILQFQ